jgi:acylphosphatase
MMGEIGEKHVRILIRGKKVKHVGYRLLIAHLALRQRLKRFDVDNVTDGVEVLAGDEEKKIDKFYNSLKASVPPHARSVEILPPEPYEDADIPTLDEYVKYDFPALHAETTSEIVSEGLALRTVVAKLPDGIADSLNRTLGRKLDGIASFPRRRTTTGRK